MPATVTESRYSAIAYLLVMVAGAQAYAGAKAGNARLVCQLEKRQSGDHAVSGDILYEQVVVDVIRAGKQWTVKGTGVDIQFSISSDDPDDVRDDASTLVIVARTKRNVPSGSEETFRRVELSKPWVSGAQLRYEWSEMHFNSHRFNTFFSEIRITGECHQN